MLGDGFHSKIDQHRKNRVYNASKYNDIHLRIIWKYSDDDNGEKLERYAICRTYAHGLSSNGAKQVSFVCIM